MASSHLLHHIFRPPFCSSSSSSFLFTKPLCFNISTTTLTPLRTFFFLTTPLSSSSSPPPLFFNSSSSSSSPSLFSSLQTHSSPISHLPDKFVLSSENEHEQLESHNKQQEEEEESVELQNINSPSKLPSLTVKEKKELAAYAHSLGKKLKCQQVGKSGVTSSVAAAFVENLESNELLKLKIHNSCPGELADVVKLLEEATGSVAVGQIGRAVILYRPSLTKLKAEEKKKQARRVFTRKRLTTGPTFEVKKQGQELKPSGRGHRGSSRFRELA